MMTQTQRLTRDKLINVIFLIVLALGLTVACAEEKDDKGSNAIKKRKNSGDKVTVGVPVTDQDRENLEQMNAPSRNQEDGSTNVASNNAPLNFPVFDVNVSNPALDLPLSEVEVTTIPPVAEDVYLTNDEILNIRVEDQYKNNPDVISDDPILVREVDTNVVIDVTGVTPLYGQTGVNTPAIEYHEILPRQCRGSLIREAYCFFRNIPDRSKDLADSENCNPNKTVIVQNSRSGAAHLMHCDPKYTEDEAFEMAQDLVEKGMTYSQFQEYREIAYFLLNLRHHQPHRANEFVVDVQDGSFKSFFKDLFAKEENMAALNLAEKFYDSDTDEFEASTFKHFFKCKDAEYVVTGYYERENKNRKNTLDDAFDAMDYYLKERTVNGIRGRFVLPNDFRCEYEYAEDLMRL